MERVAVALIGLAALVAPGTTSAESGWRTAGPVPGTQGIAGAVSPAAGAPLYLDGFRSLDGGRHWLRSRRPLPSRVQTLVPAPSDARTAYAVDSQGHVWRTTD